MINKKTILVVDDEENIVQALQRILELSGKYEIITALNGKEALTKIGRHLPDLIISDIVMPEMDGFEFCRQIRSSELTRNIPFIFLTAKKELMVQGFKAGADDFIKKPFTFDEVMAKIEAIIRRMEHTKEQASQVKGDLKEQNLDRILHMCSLRSISGMLILQNRGKIGEIMLDKGEIARVTLMDLPENQALDEMRSWRQGLFIIRPEGIELEPGFMSGDEPRPEEQIAEAVKIAEDTWWVGYRNPDRLLQLNVYLRRFRKNRKSINLLIDPGSPLDFPVVSQKITGLLGNISKINLYSLHHPDPDVAMNSVYIRNANPKAICLTSEENWRLLMHYEIDSQSVKLINTFPNYQARLATGHQIRFIPSPFCHAKGAFMIYDLETRVLFTGDLFGGISDAGRISQLYAEEPEWEGVRAFHQIYMPTKRAVRYAIEQIRALDPPPLIIAPQHGALLRGDVLDRFMERLFNLDVGADLLYSEEIKEWIEQYTAACNDLIDETAGFMPLDEIRRRILSNDRIVAAADFKKGRFRKIFSRPEEVFEQLILSLVSGAKLETSNQIKSLALKVAHGKGLPAPHLDWENEPTLTTTPVSLFDEDSKG